MRSTLTGCYNCWHTKPWWFAKPDAAGGVDGSHTMPCSVSRLLSPLQLTGQSSTTLCTRQPFCSNRMGGDALVSIAWRRTMVLRSVPWLHFAQPGTPRIPEASPARTMTIGPTETGGQKCAIRGTTVDALSLTADTNISVRNAVRQRTKPCTALPTREQDQHKKGEALKSRRAWPETAWT